MLNDRVEECKEVVLAVLSVIQHVIPELFIGLEVFVYPNYIYQLHPRPMRPKPNAANICDYKVQRQEKPQNSQYQTVHRFGKGTVTSPVEETTKSSSILAQVWEWTAIKMVRMEVLRCLVG